MEAWRLRPSLSKANVRRQKLVAMTLVPAAVAKNTRSAMAPEGGLSGKVGGEEMRVTVEKRPIVVPGFRFAGVACGIKPSGKKDVGLIVSEVPATAVAAFTTNKSTAAPVLVGRERIKTGCLQAVVVNSGIANVATGQLGLRLARDACALVARTLGINENLVLPSSTGKIG